MKHIVSFSGGRTSAYLVHLMEQKQINEGWDVEYIFNDTGAEHPKTYEFIRNVVKHWGIDLTCLQSVVDSELGVGNGYRLLTIDSIGWDNLENVKANIKKYGQFTIKNPFCTERMKTLPTRKYLLDKYGNDYMQWLGMRIDEPRRLKNFEVQTDFFDGQKKVDKKIRYLAHLSDFTKQDILDWWDRQPFDLEISEHLGNCIFCIKKGAKKVALAARDCPEQAKQWIDCFDDTSVRKLPASKSPHGVIYRNHQSLGSIIQMFSDFSDDEILKTSKRSGGDDSGSCSESCEFDLSQPDMFAGLEK